MARYTGSFAEYVSVPGHKSPSSRPPSPSVPTPRYPSKASPPSLSWNRTTSSAARPCSSTPSPAGATVIGTTSNAEKAELARRHGADHVILYTQEDTVKRVLEITNGKGVHSVFDGVGKDTFESNFEMLLRKGSLISVGNASGPVPPFSPLKLTGKNIKLTRPTYTSLATKHPLRSSSTM